MSPQVDPWNPLRASKFWLLHNSEAMHCLDHCRSDSRHHAFAFSSGTFEPAMNTAIAHAFLGGIDNADIIRCCADSNHLWTGASLMSDRPCGNPALSRCCPVGESVMILSNRAVEPLDKVDAIAVLPAGQPCLPVSPYRDQSDISQAQPFDRIGNLLDSLLIFLFVR